ncbi:MAG: DUF4129 domain-containing protein [Nocardioidaceae bacterium]|nr:DUF4129 domain-containing protein [Nocardioidaceae bacterium]
MPALVALAPTLRPDPDPARDWVREELAKPEYQPTLMERALRWLNELLDKLVGGVRDVGLVNPVLALVLLGVLLGLAVLLLSRLRRDPSRPERTAAVLTEERISAAEHRALASRALAEERWDDVVVEAMRALAVGLVERDLIDDQPGATAREVADAGARLFGAHAERLHRAADAFDGVLYGDHRADRVAATALLDLEADLRRARPSEEPSDGPVLAVPR